MTYSAQEARAGMVADLGSAIGSLALAVAALSEAFEQLDERTADALEERLFRPVQHAYGLARRTQSDFAGRHGLSVPGVPSVSPGMHTGDPRVYVQRALDAVGAADDAISELQDSLMPVEVGDPPLRAGLSETRTLLGPLPVRGITLLRGLGR